MVDWSEQEKEVLTRLWDEGHSTAEIGRRMGRSKNSIVGGAHRLDLPDRPSPIRRDGAQDAPLRRSERGRPVATRRATLPPMPSFTAPPIIAPREIIDPRRLQPSPAPIQRVVAPPPQRYGRIVQCCYLAGERPYVRCDNPAEPGLSWCADHAKRVLVRVGDRREDATP